MTKDPLPSSVDEGSNIIPPNLIPGIDKDWTPQFGHFKNPFSFLQFGWLYFGLGGILLGSAAALGWRYSRQPWIPTALPTPELPGPRRLPLLPLPDSGPEFLDADAARTMIWGVERHQTENLTTEIDVEHTVDETAAKGGLPQLHYKHEQILREVWLWIDGTVEDPMLERYCKEIADSLKQAGLPMRIGGFEGYPQELTWDEGQPFRPEELEGHRQTALVAVLTDGEVLMRHTRDTRRESVLALLRALASWERLTFVDFSRGGSEPAAFLRSFGIPCLDPEVLPEFFGIGTTVSPVGFIGDPGELRAWRAALALSTRSVGWRATQALRRELDLGLSPWQPEMGPAQWDAESFEPLRWLRDAELEGTRIPEGSRLDRALKFWERWFEEEEDRRAEGELEAWKERPAGRYLQMERAILMLWRQPAEAVEKLFELKVDLAEEIRQRLERLAPADCWRADKGRAPLPWCLEDQTHRIRYLLAELGLGGVVKGELRKPGRLGVALGTMVGLGVFLLLEGLRWCC